MTAFFTTEAASGYLRLTLFAFDSGLIGSVEFEARLNTLRALAGHQGGAALYAEELIGDAIEDDEWGEVEPLASRDESPLQTGEAGRPYWDDADHSIAFRMVAGPLQSWEFHQADDDYFPSIPHGHEHGRKQPKLDVYLGWVYHKAKQVRRIERSAIVELWNDRDFRDFARIAIDYYLTNFSNYSGWRVNDPRLLPSIRRGSRFRNRR